MKGGAVSFQNFDELVQMSCLVETIRCKSHSLRSLPLGSPPHSPNRLQHPLCNPSRRNHRTAPSDLIPSDLHVTFRVRSFPLQKRRQVRHSSRRQAHNQNLPHNKQLDHFILTSPTLLRLEVYHTLTSFRILGSFALLNAYRHIRWSQESNRTIAAVVAITIAIAIAIAVPSRLHTGFWTLDRTHFILTFVHRATAFATNKHHAEIPRNRRDVQARRVRLE